MALLYIPLYILYAGLFLWLIYRWGFFDIDGVKKHHLAFFFVLKAIAGIGLTLVYTYYYKDQDKADIYRYFNDSKIISSVLFVNPLAWLKIITGMGYLAPDTFSYLHNTWHFSHPANDIITSNAFLIRIISVLNYFSGYNIYIDTLLLNAITFISLTVLFKVLKPYFEDFYQILYLPLFLTPSFVFWSSGLLKEGLVFTGMAGYLWAWLGNQKRSLWQSVMVGCVSFLMVAYTKIYVAGILLLCSVFLPVKIAGANGKKIRVIVIGACVVFAAVLGYYQGDKLCSKVIDKRNEFMTLALTEHSGSALDITFSNAGCGQLVALVPSALVNTILRPFPYFDNRNLFLTLFAAENGIMIVLMLLVLVFYFKRPIDNAKLWLAVFCLSFAVLNFLGIGITVPVLGAIVHYRIVALPFLWMGILLFTDLKRLRDVFIKSLKALNIKF